MGCVGRGAEAQIAPAQDRGLQLRGGTLKGFLEEVASTFSGPCFPCHDGDSYVLSRALTYLALRFSPWPTMGTALGPFYRQGN